MPDSIGETGMAERVAQTSEDAVRSAWVGRSEGLQLSLILLLRKAR